MSVCRGLKVSEKVRTTSVQLMECGSSAGKAAKPASGLLDKGVCVRYRELRLCDQSSAIAHRARKLNLQNLGDDSSTAWHCCISNCLRGKTFLPKRAVACPGYFFLADCKGL